MFPLVSVIIPVYNVRPYLRESLDSVINQTYKNLEIIVVDDGSTDGSSEICDGYHKKDNRIRVIHQKNRGLSSARNTGLDVAHGEIIAFLDSDDAFLPDMIEILVNGLENSDSDIAVCGFYTCMTTQKMRKQKSNRTYTPSEGVISSKTALTQLIDDQLNITVWNKLYRKRLFAKMRFPEGYMFEDLLLLPELIKQANQIALVAKPMVLYRKRPHSITTSYSDKNIFQWIKAKKAFEEFVSKNIPELFLSDQLDHLLENDFKWLIHLYLNLLSKSRLTSNTKIIFAKEIKHRFANQSSFCVKTVVLYYLFIINPYLCLTIKKIYSIVVRMKSLIKRQING